MSEVMIQFSSVQFSRSVMSDSLRPHESQYARPPRPSPTPWVHSDSCPSSQWCHPAISSSVVPFSSCPQSLPASESFPMSQLFAWGAQSTGVSTSASFLPEKSQGWSPSEWTGWISLQSKEVMIRIRVIPNRFLKTENAFQTCRVLVFLRNMKSITHDHLIFWWKSTCFSNSREMTRQFNSCPWSAQRALYLQHVFLTASQFSRSTLILS